MIEIGMKVRLRGTSANGCARILMQTITESPSRSKRPLRASGLKRALLYIAIGRGTLRAHKCGARALILQSDLQRFLTVFCKAPNPKAHLG
jgi:hypothetical protein